MLWVSCYLCASIIINYLLTGIQNNLICDGKISLFEEILTKNSFDEVIKDMKSTFPSGFFERYVHYLNKYSEIFSRKVPLDFFNYLFSSPALCLIPEEIAISLRVLPYSSSNRPVDMGFLRKKVLYERTNINVWLLKLCSI